MGEYRWIAENIDVSEIIPKLPQYIKEMIAEMEKADKEDNMPVFAQVMDDFEIYTKLLTDDDTLSVKEWRTLCAKYSFPAE